MKIYFNDLLVEKNRIVDDQWVKGNSGNKLEVYFEDNILESSAVNVRAVIEWADGSTTNELVLNKSIKKDFAYLNLPILKTDGEVKFTLKIYSNDSLQQTTLFSRKVYNSINASDEIHISSSEYESLLEAIESACVDVDDQVKENTDNIELLLEAYEKGGLKYFDKVFAEDEIINLFNINGNGKYSIKSALYGDEIVIVNVENQYVSRFNGNATLTYDFEKNEWVKQTGSIESEGNTDFELIKNKITRWESLENDNQYPSASLVKSGLDSKLDKEQGNDNAYKVAVTNRFGNVYFENKLPKVNMPEIEADDLPEIPKDKLPQITVDMLPSGAGIIAEIAEELRADGGNITGNDIKNKLQTLDDMTATVECKHAIEITGNTGDEHNLAVEDQQMLLNKIQGQSLVVNQLIDQNFIQSTNLYGVTINNNGNGTFTLNGTATTDFSILFNEVEFIKGHKYVLLGFNDTRYSLDEVSIRVYAYEGNTQFGMSIAKPSGSIPFGTASFTVSTSPYMYVFSGTIIDNLVLTPELIDLTQMFGAGNEPKTVNEFYSRYNQGYIPYNEGTFKHSKCNLISTGKNLWDEQWQLGFYNVNNGEYVSSTDYICSKNYINIVPNTTYYLKVPSPYGLAVLWYDANKNYISYNSTTNSTVISPSNAKYGMIYINNSAYGTTYNNDICINVSDVNFNGTYEPYKKEVFVVNEELKAFDYIQDDKLFNASGEMVVDTNSIIEVTGYGYQNITYFKIDKPLDFVGRGNTGGNVICSKYQLGIGGGWDDANKIGLLFLTADHYNFWFGFPKGTTLEQAKAELNGVKLIYELSTPTVIDLDVASGYAVYKGGYQIQDGEVPYILTKEYSMSVKAQILANIEIDREQQEQLNEIKEEINEAVSTADSAYNLANDALENTRVNAQGLDTLNKAIDTEKQRVTNLETKVNLIPQNDYGIANVNVNTSYYYAVNLGQFNYWKAVIDNVSFGVENEIKISFNYIDNLMGEDTPISIFVRYCTLEYIKGCLIITEQDLYSFDESEKYRSYILSNREISISYVNPLNAQDGFSIYWKGERT